MYIVLEIQKTGDQIATLVTSYQNRNEAESKFYTVLAAAALSTVEKHAASLLTDNGICIRSEAYEHPVETIEESVQ